MFSVIFDMDGVLVDSEPVILEAAMLGLKEYGIQAVPEDFRPFVGAGEDRFVGGVAEKHGVPYRTEMKDRVYEIYLEIVPDKIRVFEGVHALLTMLSAREIRFALGSAADRIKVDANLKAARIPVSWFSAVISAENVTNKKPAPDIFLKAAAAMDVNPSDCIVVEDAVNGIKAAKAAGMRCIAVASSFSRETLSKEHPDYICPDIPGVHRLLAGMLG